MSRKYARLLVAGGWLAVLLLLWACGSGGGGIKSLVPIAGNSAKSYDAPLTGGELAGANCTVQVTNKTGGAITKPADVEVRVTTSDGTYIAQEVTVDKVEEGRIEGTVPAPTGRAPGTVRVILTFNADGTSVNISFVFEDNSTSSGNGTAPNAAALLATATTKLQNLLTKIAHEQKVTDADVAAVYAAYNAARSAAPNNAQANFGLALSIVADAAAKAAVKVGHSLDELDHGGADTQARFVIEVSRAMINPIGGVVDTLSNAGDAAGVALMPLQPASVVSRANSALETYANAVSAVNDTLLPALEKALTYIGVPAGLSSFSYDLTFKDMDEVNQTLEMGQTEAQLLQAALGILAGAAHQLLVYNLDVPDRYRMTDAMVTDGTLTPAEYLPPTPLLALRTDGQAQSQKALSAFQNALASAKLVWASVKVSNSIAGQDLDEQFGLSGEPTGVGRALTAEEKDNITLVLDELYKAFTTEYTPNWTELNKHLDDPVSTADQAMFGNLNIPAFWNNPPADLRSILPSFGYIADYPTWQLLGSQWQQVSGKQFIVGTYNATDYGSWPMTSGRVTLGGLLSPGIAPADIVEMLGLVVFSSNPTGPNEWGVDGVTTVAPANFGPGNDYTYR